MVAQSECTPTPIYAKIKEWLTFASVIVVVAGGIAAGLLGGMKLVIAPLQTDIRAIHGRLDQMHNGILGRLDQMDSHIQELDNRLGGLDNRVGGLDSRVAGLDSRLGGLEHSMQNGFKAVREDISAFGERLVRVETLLEQVVRQPDTPQ